MKCVMLGSGAVGSYFGAKLQQAGHEVVFVARGERLRVLRGQGLTLCSDAEQTTLPVTATDDAATLSPVDFVLISVKSWQVEEAVQALPPLRARHTRFLTLQNGVEAPHIVAKCLGAGQVLGGLVRGFFQMEASGAVRHVGVQPSIVFGQLNGPRTAEAQQLLRCLADAGVHAELLDDIELALWKKFLLVASLSGVGAVTRATIGALRDYAPTRRMLESAMLEIAAVARARGIALPDDVIARTLKFVDTFPYEATTSMQRDLMNGLPSELEAQTGAVLRLGREASVATPVNQYLYDSLSLQEMRVRT